MILLTDTFGVEQIETACTVSVEKVEIEEVQAALAQAKVFDTYFEFEELALDAQDVLGVQVPETEIKKRPTFKDDFTLFVVGYKYHDIAYLITFWRVVGVVRPARQASSWEYEKEVNLHSIDLRPVEYDITTLLTSPERDSPLPLPINERAWLWAKTS